MIYCLRCAVEGDLGARGEAGRVTVLKTFGLFIVALLGELGGTYAIWRWLRTDSPPLLALVAFPRLRAGREAVGHRAADVDPRGAIRSRRGLT